MSSVALHCVTAASGARVLIIMRLAEVPESGLFVAEVAKNLETLPAVTFNLFWNRRPKRRPKLESGTETVFLENKAAKAPVLNRVHLQLVLREPILCIDIHVNSLVTYQVQRCSVAQQITHFLGFDHRK